MLRHVWLRLSYALFLVAFLALALTAWRRLSSDHPNPDVPSLVPGSSEVISSSDIDETAMSQLAIQDDTPEGHLVTAAATGDLRSLREGLDSGVSADARNAEGRGALHLAAANGETDAVRTLREAGAGVDEPDSIGWSPLMWAAYYGSLAGTTALLEAGADANARYEPHRVTALEQLVGGMSRARSKGYPPLREEDRVRIGELLFVAGADPNLGGVFGSPLRFAPDFLDSLDLLNLFFEHGARIDDLPELWHLADRRDAAGELFRRALEASGERVAPE